MSKLKQKLKSMDKRILYGLSFFVLACAVLLTSFTFAWFTSRDEVTNSLESNVIDITLLEPAWYDSGQELAKTAEPGMCVPKDPYVLNNSNIAVYVRMKVVIKVKDEDGSYAALKAQYDNMLKNYVLCSYTKASGNTAVNPVMLLSSTDTSNNANYFYEDGWFYYGEKATTTTTGDTMTTTTTYTFTPLASGGNTVSLFSGILIPATESEYNNGVFNEDFRIDVEAQAIAADANLSAEEVFNKFTK